MRSIALCSYKGKMYAKTTLAEEYRDSKWVVRVKVLAVDSHSSDFDDSWTIYTVQVRTAYKGHPTLRVRMFTYRDSGGFYLDKGMHADLGGEYLLFLDPVSGQVPAAARQSTEVNDSCGQSKEWSAFTSGERAKLGRLARGKQVNFNQPLPTDENHPPHIR